MGSDSTKNKRHGLEIVVLRNLFYRDGYVKLMIAVALILLINVGLAVMLFYKITHPPQPQYFASTADGRIIKIHPLSDPDVSDDFVLQWTADAARKAFSWDFLHWREQLQSVSGRFTPDGWRDFSETLKNSNNLKTVTDLKMVSNIEITGSPKIIRKAVIGGHYAWNVVIPVLLSFNSSEKTINQPLRLTIIVLREPVQYYPQKIAINNLDAATGSESAYGRTQ